MRKHRLRTYIRNSWNDVIDAAALIYFLYRFLYTDSKPCHSQSPHYHIPCILPMGHAGEHDGGGYVWSA